MNRRRFKPYGAYKESGVAWIGKIPAHWTVNRTKFAARLRSGHTPSRLHPEYWENCTIPWFGLADVWQIRDGRKDHVHETAEKISQLGLANSAARLLPKGTVMLSRTASVGFAAIMGTDMATTQDFVNWVCGQTLRPDYLLNVFRSMGHEFRRLTMGSTHQTIYMPDVGGFSTPIPPLPEQDRIVAFIRRETERIDALVEKKRSLIALLEEQRSSAIIRAITKGLTHNAPMKASGSDWLGEIPAHWSVERIKSVARMESGHTPDKKVDGYWVGGTIPWVSLADTGQLRRVDYVRSTAVHTTPLGLANSSAHLLPVGTVVFSRDATVGLCAITEVEMAVSQHFIGWVCSPAILPAYLLLVLRSMTQELERVSMGATIATIGMPDVRGLTTPIPPIAEQERIIAYAYRKRDELESLIAKVRQAIEHLNELRTTTIAAAVTGQIDVRGAGA